MSSEHNPSHDAFPTNEKIRREIVRSITIIGVVLAIVLGLTLAMVLTGARATRNEQRAIAAEADGMDRLWNSYLAQAKALRLTYTAGRREQTLQVISNAAALHSDWALRTEAAAALALTDLQREHEIGGMPRNADEIEVDSARERFVYGDAQGRAFVVSIQNRSNVVTFDGRTSGAGFRMPVQNVSFSPDDKLLCVRHTGGAVALWDVKTQKMIFSAGAETTNKILAGIIFSPDSRTLYFSDPDRAGQITKFDIERCERVLSAIAVGARMVRFRPGTSQVAINKDNKVELFEYPSETVLQTFELTSRSYVIAWSPDGNSLAASGGDGDVHLWNLPQKTHHTLRGHSEPCLRLGFSPDSRLVFTGSRDGTTRLWEAAQGLLLATAEDGMGNNFYADGSRLGYARFAPTIGSWKVEKSDCFATLHCPSGDGTFNGMDLSPDGRWCVAAQTRGLRVWDLSSGAKEKFFPIRGLNSARIAANGKSIFVCTTNALERWPIIASNELSFGTIDKIALPDNKGARFLAESLNGTTAAVELEDLRFATIDLTGKRAPVLFHDRWRAASLKGSASGTGAGRFAISPDARWIVTGYYFGPKDEPRIWDAHTATAVPTPAMTQALPGFSSDGKWLALCGQGDYRIYSAGDWKLAKTIPRDEVSFTYGSLAFVGTGGEVAVTRTRQQLQLRAGDSDEQFLDLIPPSIQSWSSLRVSTNGNVLAAGSARDVIHIWRLDKLRASLGSMNLGWGAGSPVPSVASPSAQGWLQSHALLTFGGAAFALVSVLSVLAFRHHRATIERFFAAEATASERHRDLESAQVELMQSQKMRALGTLPAGIAHDFNNLLSVIRMSNKLIGRAHKTDPELQENVAEIEQAVMQGKNVVGSMLGYARNEDESTSALDVCSIVEETVSLLSKEFLSGITLTLELDRHAPLVQVARGQIEQILLNLVVNASEAMQGKGKLKITVHPRQTLPPMGLVLWPETAPQHVEMVVMDSGPGIPLEIRDRVFEPFFTTKRSGVKPGTGLGLSLVYSIAQQEKFGLKIDSEPGRGAAFSILIPVRHMHSSQPQNSS